LVGICVVAAVVILMRGLGTEAERVEAETLAAGERLKVMNGGTARTPILMKLDFRLRDTFGQSPRDYYVEQFDKGYYVEQFNKGMDRLLELGVLEVRRFPISDTNAFDRVMRIVPSGVTPIWSAAWDGKVLVVTAKKGEMGKWEAVIRRLHTNAAAVGTN
jgi:hypothetical protein